MLSPYDQEQGKDVPSQYSFQHCTGKKKKEITGIQTGKEEIKPSVFADDMIVSIENPKESTKKLPKLINDYSKLAGYKVTCFLIYQPMNNWDLK